MGGTGRGRQFPDFPADADSVPMGELEAEHDALELFAASGRSGRRNALPEIEVQPNDPDGTKLAERLSDMTAHCDSQGSSRKEQPTTSQPQSTNS